MNSSNSARKLLRNPIEMRVKHVVHRAGEKFFYIVWNYYIGGRKHPQGSNFPFSMS